MKEEVRILLGLFIFYLIYVFLSRSTSLSNIPLIIVVGIFVIYLFLPDISCEGNMFNKNKQSILSILFISAVIVFLVTKLLLVPLLIVGLIAILYFISNSPSIFKSFTTGIYLSAPLFLLSPFYFLFAFLGFLTFWVASRI